MKIKAILQFLTSLNWTKDDLKKFIFCSAVLIFSVIIFHIFPIKIVIDTNAMYKTGMWHYRPNYKPLRIDVSGIIDTDTSVRGSIDVEPKGLAFPITNF